MEKLWYKCKVVLWGFYCIFHHHCYCFCPFPSSKLILLLILFVLSSKLEVSSIKWVSPAWSVFFIGGSSKTLMIVNVCPNVSNLSETLSSLNFSARARNSVLSLGNRDTIKKWRDVVSFSLTSFLLCKWFCSTYVPSLICDTIISLRFCRKQLHILTLSLIDLWQIIWGKKGDMVLGLVQSFY